MTNRTWDAKILLVCSDEALSVTVVAVRDELKRAIHHAVQGYAVQHESAGSAVTTYRCLPAVNSETIKAAIASATHGASVLIEVGTLRKDDDPHV